MKLSDYNVLYLSINQEKWNEMNQNEYDDENDSPAFSFVRFAIFFCLFFRFCSFIPASSSSSMSCYPLYSVISVEIFVRRDF